MGDQAAHVREPQVNQQHVHRLVGQPFEHRTAPGRAVAQVQRGAGIYDALEALARAIVVLDQGDGDPLGAGVRGGRHGGVRPRG